MCSVHAGYNNSNQIHAWTFLIDITEFLPHQADIEYLFPFPVYKTIGWGIVRENNYLGIHRYIILVNTKFKEYLCMHLSTSTRKW